MCSGCEQSYPEGHDLEAVTGEPGKLFQPVCIREGSEWRPVGTPVSVPV